MVRRTGLLLPIALALPAAAPKTNESPIYQSDPVAASRDFDLRTATAGQQASSIYDLVTLIQNTCELQPWQFSIADKGDKRITVQMSPTLDQTQRGCMSRVIDASKFRAQ